MNPTDTGRNELARRNRVFWWPTVVVCFLAGSAVAWIRTRPEASFQERNLQTLAICVCTAALLLLWWLIAGPSRWRLRLLATAGLVVLIAVTCILFRLRGVSGDLLPLLEPRWSLRPAVSGAISPVASHSGGSARPDADFPQFLGPNRNAMLQSPAILPEWTTNPPKIVWRKPVGAAWSGFAIKGKRALTQEQRAEDECSTCYDLVTGELLWSASDSAHYQTKLAGEGPRCTPTVVSNRVFALGATGRLNCLDLETGRRFWSHNIVEDAKSHVPEWGFAGSPLVFDGKVVVSAGGNSGRSLLAYRVDNGELCWSGGDQPASYSSPVLVSLAGVQQVLCFNHRRITAHDPASGQVLWEYPWGNGQPEVAVPVVVSSNRVLFSSGYGVGSEMLELKRSGDGHLEPRSVWRSKKLKAKFANLVQRDGFLYGLDDGILACLDLSDGSQRWKEGRYGHGQGLLIRDLFLLMAENGELVLLHPTPGSPRELSKFRVFHNKTWNPIALSGDLLLVRNDQEAACLSLAVESRVQPK